MRKIILGIILVLIIYLAIDSLRIYKIVGVSMYPEIQNEDLVVVFRFDSYLNKMIDVNIRKGTIYTVESPSNNGPDFVKRNYGHSGEELNIIIDRYIYFLGTVSESHPRIKAFKDKNLREKIYSTFEFNRINETKNNESLGYFFISDWPFGTFDSRKYGYFYKENINGVIIYNLSH